MHTRLQYGSIDGASKTNPPHLLPLTNRAAKGDQTILSIYNIDRRFILQSVNVVHYANDSQHLAVGCQK